MSQKPKKFNYKQQYGVIVICESEDEQKKSLKNYKKKD